MSKFCGLDRGDGRDLERGQFLMRRLDDGPGWVIWG
jgi:hypothetical protein